MKRSKQSNTEASYISKSKLYEKNTTKSFLAVSSRNGFGGTKSSIIPFSQRVAYLFGAFGLLFLVAVHIHLFRTLLSHETLLSEEFNLKGSHMHMVVPHRNQSSTQKENHRFLTENQRFLTPLRETDYEMFTVRINSWKRAELLETSVAHHASCPGVAQVQVVWCNDQGEPPPNLSNYEKVVIERHPVNSLNERFHLISEPPTIGILSIDDDVLRPCDAIDAGFFKWTHNPERMVGFDARSHIVVNPQTNEWSYSYLSTTKQTNQYSMTLPRYAFLHRDYLRWYMNDMPPLIIETVANNLNCEDIAMSFMVSHYTDGKPPLLADYWAMRTQIKLFVESSISYNATIHKAKRDACVDEFADLLNLKGKLVSTTFVHKGDPFSCGADGKTSEKIHNDRQRHHQNLVNYLKTLSKHNLTRAVTRLTQEASKDAYFKGLIHKTSPWKKRWLDKSDS